MIKPTFPYTEIHAFTEWQLAKLKFCANKMREIDVRVMVHGNFAHEAAETEEKEFLKTMF